MDCVDNRESEKGEEAYGLTAYDYILSQIKENMAADADMEIPISIRHSLQNGYHM